MKATEQSSIVHILNLVLDKNLTILSSSKPISTFLGIKSDLELQNVDSIFTILLKNNKDLALDQIHEFCDHAFEGRYINLNIKYKSKYYHLLFIPIKDLSQEIQNIQILFEDITSIKNQILELNKQNQDLIDANTTKDKFFSIIAHDLKNPLSTFKQVTEILYEEMDNLELDDIKEYIFDLKNSALSSLQLLENLLEWAGIQRGKIKYNPAENYLQMIVANTIALLQIKAEQKNIHLYSDIENEMKVYCDANMIMTIVRNLCTNALKFTPEDGYIKVWAKVDHKVCLVCIEDSGIGIKPEDIDKLFRIDVHHSTIGTSSEEGTGLGLILCKEFAEIHDGKIWVESKLGKGSQFFFTIPLA